MRRVIAGLVLFLTLAAGMPAAGAGGDGVSRAEFIRLMAQAGGLPEAALVVPSDYGDPPDFQPDRPVTRQEAAIFAMRAMNRLGAALTLHRAPWPLYLDEAPDWATGYLAAANSAGVMKGDPETGTFGPGEPVTRAEAAAIAERVAHALQAVDLPVWEGNSWEVSTLPYAATQVAAAPDGTLWWLNGAEIWRMAPFAEAVKVATLQDAVFETPMAAESDGLYVGMGAGIVHITPDGQIVKLVDDRGVSGLCLDAQGTLYATDYNTLRKVDRQGHVTTVAGLTERQALVLEYGMLYGRPTNLNEGPDGPAYLARMRPSGCAVDPAGNIFVVDADTQIRKVSPDGWVSWVAGSELGASDGAVEEAGFGRVRGLTADAWGNLWLLDEYERVRRITPDGHVYTVAGGGGRPIKTGVPGHMWWAGWVPDNQRADGPGPDARFSSPTSVALSGGKLFIADGALRAITGRLGWYPAEKSVVLQPRMDDKGFWVMGEGRYRTGLVRLPVALYAPAEAVGLEVDGQRVAEAHHPIYTLRWDATAGEHTITPLIRWPDGTWGKGEPAGAMAFNDGYSTDRNAILLPRDGSWLRGTVAVKAVNFWGGAELFIDGKPVAKGDGLLSATWDTTQVADGLHWISLVTGRVERVAKQVYVANGGFPPREPEGGGFVGYLKGKRHVFQVPPRTVDEIPMLPFHETALALGFTTAWESDSRLLTVAGDGRSVTLNVDTLEVTGMTAYMSGVKPVAESGEYLVDWSFFVSLVDAEAAMNEPEQILIIH
jgi:hypothetical protein